MIISHTILILQLRYSREATANRAPGQPLVFTAPGRFESAPVGYFNVEVAAAAGGGGGDDDDDDDDDDNNDDDDDDDDDDDGNQKPSVGGIIFVPRAERQRDHRGNNYASRREYRKRKGKSLSDGPIKLVRGGGWCDNCNAASANDQESNDAPFGK